MTTTGDHLMIFGNVAVFIKSVHSFSIVYENANYYIVLQTYDMDEKKKIYVAPTQDDAKSMLKYYTQEYNQAIDVINAAKKK